MGTFVFLDCHGVVVVAIAGWAEIMIACFANRMSNNQVLLWGWAAIAM
ncbi:hypothetical protein [Synechocystis sp. LEGE 06083]|nr:hypothetical protein [Synechocystis sp. LEGE 06083]